MIRSVNDEIQFEKGRLSVVKDYRRLIYKTNEHLISAVLSSTARSDKKIDHKMKDRAKGTHPNLLHDEGIGHTKFKKTRIGEMPEEWQLELSHDLFSFVTSGSRDWAKYYSQRGTIMIRIENLDHETIYPDFTTVKRVALPDGIEGLRTRVKPNDIWFRLQQILAWLG